MHGTSDRRHNGSTESETTESATEIRQEWDRLRQAAWTQSERAEIDAMFSRYVA